MEGVQNVVYLEQEIGNFIIDKFKQEYKEHLLDINFGHSYGGNLEINFSLEEHIVVAEKLSKGSNFLQNFMDEINGDIIMKFPLAHSFYVNIHLHIKSNVNLLNVEINLGC